MDFWCLALTILFLILCSRNKYYFCTLCGLSPIYDAAHEPGPNNSAWHGGSGACTAASQQEGHRFDSRMGRCWLWGAGPPQSAQCSGGLSPGPFCVECMFSPCSQEVSSTKN